MIRTGDAKGAFASSVQRPGSGVDIWLLTSAGILTFIGLASIHSIDISRTGSVLMVKQMLWAAIGLVVFLICSAMTPKLLERLSPFMYGASVVSLLAVRVIGKSTKGASRWIDFGPIQFQPSEFAKVILIVTLAVYFSKRWESRRELGTFLGSLAHAAPVIILVLMQPHLAGAMSLVMIWLAVSIYAGVSWKYVAATVGIGGVLFGAALLGSGQTVSYKVSKTKINKGASVGLDPYGYLATMSKSTSKLKFVGTANAAVDNLTGPAGSKSLSVTTPGIVPAYMLGRILGKINPDEKGNAYQQDRAEIAFGVGGVPGVGYGKGEQKAARYIPEQQNDFIFTVIGEELGLVGGGLTIALFGFFFFRVWLVGYRATEPIGRMISAGVLAVLGFHTAVNLGMNIGVLPVAGLWLPFISYGGTALWMCMACVGLLASVK